MTAGRQSALAQRRRSLGLSQEALADKLSVDARTIGRWERGESNPQPWQRAPLARALQLTIDELARHLADARPGREPLAGGDLGIAHASESGFSYSGRGLEPGIGGAGDAVPAVARRSVLAATASVFARRAGAPISGALLSARPSVTWVYDTLTDASGESCRVTGTPPGPGGEWEMVLPAGRRMPGTSAAARLVPGRLKGANAVLQLADLDNAPEYMRNSRRGLIGAVLDDEPRVFLADARAARAGVDTASSTLSIPAAFELDDITFGVIWAVANLDDALLSDDRTLDEARRDLRAYERLTASAVGRESTPGLNPIAHMYLGSDFCARFILRALPALGAVPIAWTKEQHGEEASTWLLFDHKYRYLQQTLSTVGGIMDRGFCIPREAVTTSPGYERVLLFLAVALMESLGIRVHLTADESYARVEGFVMAREEHNAIIADWMSGEGMWHVDLTTHPGSLRQFTDVAGDVAAASVIAAASPARRLAGLADYLELDPGWLSRRCAQLGKQGTGTLVQSRSRLISSAGLDAACRFVGSLAL
jgi:transcriptional regulator with XRE-family HTH domain